MNKKSVFISLWLTVLLVALVHSLIMVWQAPAAAGSWAALLALLPITGFFAHVFMQRTPRTAAFVRYPVIAQVVAVLILLLAGGTLWQWLYVLVVGLVGTLVYQLWYSKLDRGPSQLLRVGQELSPLTFEDADGNPVNTDEMVGPLLLIFYRGNWCPLCMAQVKEVASQYRELEARGVTTLLISPQSHDNTRDLARRFDVPFRFLVDTDLKVANSLGLFSPGGTPMGMEVLGYDSDTVFPTVVMTDSEKQILFVYETDNYRIRPEPDTFLKVLDQAV